MDIHHATGTIDGDDHKAVMLVRHMFVPWVQTNRGTQGWRAIPSPDEVGLLLRTAFIDPLKPVVDRRDGAVLQNRPEEWGMSDFLCPGIVRLR